MSRLSTTAWRDALRRGIVPIVLGLVCLALAWVATEALGPPLMGLGAILVVLGLVIVVATARTLTAEEKRVGPRA